MIGHTPPRGEGEAPKRRRLVPLLLLACLTVITLDASTGEDSPLDPARDAVGNAIGPVETLTATVFRPFTNVSDFLRDQKELRKDLSALKTENDRLRSELATTDLDRNRLAELDGLTKVAKDTGYSLVAARVVARGPSQAFSRTVTIDAGTSSGVRADMTVLNNRGLVGRVLRATRTNATVLLIVDQDSVVGARLGTNLEIGFLQGRGDDSEKGRLSLDLVDNEVMPAKGDTVVTWGSKDGVPYVAGIPVGKVEAVFSSPRESKKQAVIEPFVDFTALDTVGVVVPRATKGDREVVTAGGAE